MLGLRDAVWFAVTGETFDARVAEKARLINRAVPRDKLRAETVALAERLMKLNPQAIRACKQAVKNVRNMASDVAVDYLAAKSIELRFLDREGGREQGMKQFLDDKTYRPGHQPYARPSEKAS
jgi:trans-feruloyl-CoA hydratase/vanillin synthase